MFTKYNEQAKQIFYNHIKKHIIMPTIITVNFLDKYLYIFLFLYLNMEGIYYKGKAIGTMHIYVPGNSFYDDKKLGYIQFEGLEALINVLITQETEEISCNYFGNESIKDFKKRLEDMNLAIYLCFDSQFYNEDSVMGIKKRRDWDKNDGIITLGS